MIDILDKHNCCGCNACVQKCPINCISMHEDEEGFLYPIVDLNRCVNCHLCEKVCPCLDQIEPLLPLSCYAAQNINEDIRNQSSSGGIFTSIAEKFIAEEGIVFGARFDKSWEIVHSYTNNKEDLVYFRGSKYIQSRIGDAYKQAESFLKQGRKVLFSGTPCQISALKHYLNKEYNELMTIEVVCHGVPSPKIWREYFESLDLANVSSISHKDKSTGWRGYSFTIKDNKNKVLYSERAEENVYMIAYFRNLSVRPSCFSCPSKSGRSRADLTLADYWGIEHVLPKIDDNKGISFVCVNTEKGKTLIEHLELTKHPTDYLQSIPYNSCIYESTSEPAERIRFWEDYKRIGIQVLLTLKRPHTNIFKRILKRILK